MVAKKKEKINWELKLDIPKVSRVLIEDSELNPKVREKIAKLIEATDLVYVLFNQNLNKTKKWMKAPSNLLFGSSPLEVCLRGEGQSLVSWLKDRTSLDEVES